MFRLQASAIPIFPWYNVSSKSASNNFGRSTYITESKGERETEKQGEEGEKRTEKKAIDGRSGISKRFAAEIHGCGEEDE